MTVELWVAAIAIMWIGGSLWFFLRRKKKLKPMVVQGNSLRSDEEVVVRSQPVIVNLVMSDDAGIDHSLLADHVVTVNDLMSGKFKAYKQDESEKFDHSDDPEVGYGKEEKIKEKGDSESKEGQSEKAENKNSSEKIITDFTPHNLNF